MSRPAFPRLAIPFLMLADFLSNDSESAKLFLAELLSGDGVKGESSSFSQRQPSHSFLKTIRGVCL
jgi:hypothetical protein